MIAHERGHLFYYLQLHLRVLLEQHEHEEQAYGQSVRGCDHHLQHTLPDVVCRKLSVILNQTQKPFDCQTLIFCTHTHTVRL